MRKNTPKEHSAYQSSDNTEYSGARELL
ncbi:uncharacterized protein METZ01_LOCUS251642, partial [marine metagenome]